MCLFFQFPVFLFKAVNVFANECDYLGIDGMPVMMGNVFDFFQKFFFDAKGKVFLCHFFTANSFWIRYSCLNYSRF